MGTSELKKLLKDDSCLWTIFRVKWNYHWLVTEKPFSGHRTCSCGGFWHGSERHSLPRWWLLSPIVRSFGSWMLAIAWMKTSNALPINLLFHGGPASIIKMINHGISFQFFRNLCDIFVFLIHSTNGDLITASLKDIRRQMFFIIYHKLDRWLFRSSTLS